MRWPVCMFDLDGTLADTIPLIVDSYVHAHRTLLGEELVEADIRPWIGRAFPDIYAEREPQQAADLISVYREYNLARLVDVPAFDGIHDLLRDLRAAGATIVVVTSKKHDSAAITIKAAGLTGLVDRVVGLEDTPVHKPAPEPLLVGLAGDERPAVYVGDAATDLQAARAAGVAAIGVTWGAGTATALAQEGPDALCTTVAELRDVLLADPA